MKILVMIDMQNDFIDGALGTPEAQAIVPKVLDKLNSCEHDICFATKDTHHKDYLNTLEGQKLPVKHCIEGTDGNDLNKDVIKVAAINWEDNFELVRKYTFGSLELPKILKRNSDYISEIEIVGLCTDICVISNALILRAAYPNTKITVDASCCAGTTPEKHKMALEVMKSCQIDIINEE